MAEDRDQDRDQDQDQDQDQKNEQGWALRAARDSDYPLIVRLFADLATADPIPSVERWRRRIAPGSLIVEVDGVAAGYIYYEIFDGEGYIRHIVVSGEHRGRGVGRRLVAAVGERMRRRGCRSWRLNVRPENAPALALYRSVGMEVVHASAALRFPWTLVERLPVGARTLELVPVAEAEEPLIEAHFALPRGQLGQRRSAPGVFVRRLSDPDDPAGLGSPAQRGLGVAAFDVGFPGCFPFHVGDPGDLRAMLAGLRPLAQRPEMGVVIERHEALVQAMQAAGATINLRFVHMLGELAGAADLAE